MWHPNLIRCKGARPWYALNAEERRAIRAQYPAWRESELQNVYWFFEPAEESR